MFGLNNAHCSAVTDRFAENRCVKVAEHKRMNGTVLSTWLYVVCAGLCVRLCIGEAVRG